MLPRIGTLFTEAPGVEIQGTEPEAERFTPYPTNSKRRYYSALQKAKDVIKDFHYKVSHDLLTRHDTIIYPTWYQLSLVATGISTPPHCQASNSVVIVRELRSTPCTVCHSVHEQDNHTGIGGIHIQAMWSLWHST